MRICDTAIRKKRPSESLESGFSDGLLMGAFKPFAAWLTQNGNRVRWRHILLGSVDIQASLKTVAAR